MKKLAILEEREEDKYSHETVLKCYSCGGVELPELSKDPKVGWKNVSVHGTYADFRLRPKVQSLIDGIMTSMSSARQSEVKAWEEDITACEHTLMLDQQATGHIAGTGTLLLSVEKPERDPLTVSARSRPMRQMRSQREPMALLDLREPRMWKGSVWRSRWKRPWSSSLQREQSPRQCQVGNDYGRGNCR